MLRPNGQRRKGANEPKEPKDQRCKGPRIISAKVQRHDVERCVKCMTQYNMSLGLALLNFFKCLMAQACMISWLGLIISSLTGRKYPWDKAQRCKGTMILTLSHGLNYNIDS